MKSFVLSLQMHPRSLICSLGLALPVRPRNKHSSNTMSVSRKHSKFQKPQKHPRNSPTRSSTSTTPLHSFLKREPSRNFSIGSCASSARLPVQHGYESLVSIPSDAVWRCNMCRNTYTIQYARIDRPLGYFRCKTCHCSTNFDILNIPQLCKIPGLEYEVSVPHQIGEPEPSPRSMFLWICCVCGRSWPKIPVPWRVAPSTPQPTSWTTKRTLRSIFLPRFENTARESNQSRTPVDCRGCARYIVTFNSRCLCKHSTCATCFRAMVLVEGEDVSRRLQDGEVVEVPQDIVERKKQEIREMGLDPDEYFP